jgi:hypothetical protein
MGDTPSRTPESGQRGGCAFLIPKPGEKKQAIAQDFLAGAKREGGITWML